eukprot:scaffold1743_cov344-Prasinococcus_capsulatus_cf.AAC.1
MGNLTPPFTSAQKIIHPQELTTLARARAMQTRTDCPCGVGQWAPRKMILPNSSRTSDAERGFAILGRVGFSDGLNYLANLSYLAQDDDYYTTTSSTEQILARLAK